MAFNSKAGGSITVLIIGILFLPGFNCQQQNNKTESESEIVVPPPKKVADNASGINYLVRFGYLSAKWINRNRTSNVVARSAGRSLDPIKAAILSFQRMANLNQTGVLDDATIEAMNWPRCGVTDANSRNATAMAEARKRSESAAVPFANYVLFGTKWTTTNLTYTVTKYTNDIDRDITDAAINETLNKWAAVTRLRFIPVTKQPLMEIKWAVGDHGDGEPFDGAGGILAHSFFPPRRLSLGYGLPGDVHFDDDDAWGLRPSPGKISLAHVSLHETGHAIGLDHTTDRSAVMYPFFTQSAMSRAAKLTQDDVEGIQQLYGTPVAPSTNQPRDESGDESQTAPAHLPTTTPVPTTRRRPAQVCPYIPGSGINAITQAADQPDATFTIIGNNIYRLNDEGGIYHGYPKPANAVFQNAPAGITSLITYVHSGTTFDRRYMYLFAGDSYWRYEVRKSAASLEDADLKILQGPSVLQLLVQQFLLGQQQQQLKAATSPNRNIQDGNFRLQFILNSGYPKKLTVGFKGVNAPGAVAFQLVTDELIYFITGTQYWTFSPLQTGNSTPHALGAHPILKSLPIRPPLLQSAMLYNGRNYFFAANGSYWVWSPTRLSPDAAVESQLPSTTTTTPSDAADSSSSNKNNSKNDLGRWSMPLNIAEWWFGCGTDIKK